MPIGVLLGLELWFAVRGEQSFTLAPPSQILGQFVIAAFDGSLWSAGAQTLGTAICGLLIGTVLGMACGIVLGLVRWVDLSLAVTLEAIRPIPSIALIPIAMLVYGLGFHMETAIVAFGTFWPNLLLTRAAVREIEPSLLDISRVLGLSPWQRVTKILVPASLPRMFVGLRISIGFSLVVAVTVEIAGNPIGLGAAMQFAQQALNPALMLAFLLSIALLGWGLNAFLNALQTGLFPQFAAAKAE